MGGHHQIECFECLTSTQCYLTLRLHRQMCVIRHFLSIYVLFIQISTLFGSEFCCLVCFGFFWFLYCSPLPLPLCTPREEPLQQPAKKNIIISKSNRTEWNRVMKYISYVVCLHFTPMRSNRIVIVDSHSQPFQWCFTSRTPFVCVCVCSIWQNTGFCWTFTESDLVARKYRYGKRQNTLNECPCHWSWYIYVYFPNSHLDLVNLIKMFFPFLFLGFTLIWILIFCVRD